MARIGVLHSLSAGQADGYGYIQRSARAIEDRGYHSLVVGDHLVFLDDPGARYPYNDLGTLTIPDPTFNEPLLFLSAAAQATTTLRIGTAIEIVPLRHPVERAKQVATIDCMSNGRFDYGIGVGWMKSEYDVMGIDFASRGRRADEFIAACRALWTQDRASFAGEFFNFTDAIQLPKPIQKPHPPVLVGGNSRVALRRAARNDGWIGIDMTIEQLDAALAILDHELAAAGRSRDESFQVRHSVSAYKMDPTDLGPLTEYVKQATDRGVDEITLIIGLTPATLEQKLDNHMSLLAG